MTDRLRAVRFVCGPEVVVAGAFAAVAPVVALLLTCATALSLPARLPTNCPASSLSLLVGQFAQEHISDAALREHVAYAFYLGSYCF
jgi:hypothetical protein